MEHISKVVSSRIRLLRRQSVRPDLRFVASQRRRLRGQPALASLRGLPAEFTDFQNTEGKPKQTVRILSPKNKSYLAASMNKLSFIPNFLSANLDFLNHRG